MNSLDGLLIRSTIDCHRSIIIVSNSRRHRAAYEILDYSNFLFSDTSRFFIKTISSPIILLSMPAWG